MMMKIGSKVFDTYNKTYVMGILNVTPDSFSDGGKYNNVDDALRHAEKMLEEGADLLDIGGESTRPGHEQISEEEEIKRVVPVILEVKKRWDIPISLDTYKSKVAKAGIEAGADLINDIWGLKYDEKMAHVIAGGKVACCLAHNRKEIGSQKLMRDMVKDLGETIRLAEEAGIEEEKIILDPGIGFGKTYEMNLEAIRSLEVLHNFGYPLLLGSSRKSVIGNTLDLPVEERLEGTLATTVIAVMKRCTFVRVHDILQNKRVIKMTEGILYKK